MGTSDNKVLFKDFAFRCHFSFRGRVAYAMINKGILHLNLLVKMSASPELLKSKLSAQASTSSY